MLPFSIIVSTRNRPILLERLLYTIILNSNALPHLVEVIVIDSSKSSESEQVVTFIGERIPTKLIKANFSATLPEKRNTAISHLNGSAEIVFFLDDDVEISSNFLENALECFENPNVVGVGGRDVNKNLKTPKRWQIFFKLTSTQQGVILVSGQNVEYVNSNEEMEVEWISGCVMSFRASLLDHIRFDENRHFDGEDVDFTFRASKFGKLVCSPSAKYQHSSSLSILPNKNHRIRDLIAHRCLLVLNTDGKVRFWPTYISLLVLGLAMSIKGLSKRSASLTSLGLRHIVLAFASPVYLIYLFIKREFSNK